MRRNLAMLRRAMAQNQTGRIVMLRIDKTRVIIMAAMVLVMVATFAPALKAAEIELKGITPWPKAYYWTAPFFKFQQMVDERLAGRLSIKYLGGKEVIPTFEQFEGLRNGVVDVILGVSSYYTCPVPEATAILYTKRSPSELRKNGFYDLMRELHMEKGNVVYLANVGGGVNKAAHTICRLAERVVLDMRVSLRRGLLGVP